MKRVLLIILVCCFGENLYSMQRKQGSSEIIFHEDWTSGSYFSPLQELCVIDIWKTFLDAAYDIWVLTRAVCHQEPFGSIVICEEQVRVHQREIQKICTWVKLKLFALPILLRIFSEINMCVVQAVGLHTTAQHAQQEEIGRVVDSLRVKFLGIIENVLTYLRAENIEKATKVLCLFLRFKSEFEKNVESQEYIIRSFTEETIRVDSSSEI